MANLAVSDMSKTEAIESLQRLKSAAAKFRQQAKEGGKRTVNSLVTVAGAGAAALIDKKLTTLPGFPTVPTSPVLGVLCIAVGASGYLDDQSDHVSSFGAGLLAPYVYLQTHSALSK